MTYLGIIIVVLYVLGLSVIFIYTLAQSHIAYHYLKARSRNHHKHRNRSAESDEEYPMVTIQLPIYNERYVVRRLIDSVVNFQWPRERLEIQVLDDSTDETSEIIGDMVKHLRKEDIQIHHIQRSSRVGYKAGALQFGLEKSKGTFIAIFDADFVPKPDFLLKTIPHFQRESVGMVQTRWGHLNRDYSLLTKVQAFALNAHFTVEQSGRNNAGYFMNFNGTAGVWRKSCIMDSGGWHTDTLTEDIDLSYRAQLKGWKCCYLEDVVSPAELPVTVSALKTQQYRWMKGAAETARKHLFNVWKSKFPLLKKIQASSHLLNSGIFLFILLIAVTSVPLLFVNALWDGSGTYLEFASFFLSGLLLWILFYSLPLLKDDGSKIYKVVYFAMMFPVFLSISMGLSAHNSIAVIRGYTQRTSPFIRTPKFNITDLSDSWKTNAYLITEITGITLLEGVFAIYFLTGAVAAVAMGNFAMVLFHLMLFCGFGLLFGYALYEKFAKNH